jgi:RNA polymerase sigma-70 factor (ECF subfamily)
MNARPSLSGDTIPNLEAHVPGLRRYACMLLHGDQERADDLVQDSLERALSRWHQRKGEDLRGWIYAILYRRFASDQRRRQRHCKHNISNEVLAAELPGIDGGQEGARRHRDLLRGFSELPEDQRSVLFLIGVEDFSYEEAARILGVPICTVMSRLSRGRERLRQYIDGYFRGINAVSASRNAQSTGLSHIPTSEGRYTPTGSVNVRIIRERGAVSDEPKSWSALLSRRSLLQGAAGAAGAATIPGATPNPAAAAPKMSQTAVAYQDHPDGDKRCDKCVQFQPPNACKLVDGTISSQGSCRIFMPMRQAARRSSAIPSTA